MQKMLNIAFIFFILIPIISFISCAKKSELDIPDIEFISPQENVFYTVGDTVFIKVNIESISKIRSVEFKIYDSNFNPVSSLKSSISYSNTNGEYDGRIVVNDKYILSGDYYVICVAYNETERKQKDRKIIISELDTELKDVSIVVKDNGYIKVKSIGKNINNPIVDKFIRHIPYTNTYYIPYYNRFAMSGVQTGDAVIFDYFTEDTMFVVSKPSNLPYPTFVGFANVFDNMAIMYYSENVEIYNHIGNIIYTLQCKQAYYASKIKTLNKYFAVVEKSKHSLNDNLSFRYKTTGAQYANLNLGEEIINIFPFDNNNCMIFINNSGSGSIEKYEYGSSGTTKPISYNLGKINSVSQIDKTNYILVADNTIYWYQYSNSSITPIVSGNNYSKIAYDFTSNIIYAIAGSYIYMYSFPDGQLINNRQASSDILNFHLIYNK